MTIFNFREGGQQPDGSYDFTAGTDAIAAEPAYLDLIVVCEAKEFAWHGGRGMHGFTNSLLSRAEVPLAPLLGTCDCGEHGPMLLYNTESLAIDRWFGYGMPHVPDNKRNWCEARVRDQGTRLGILPQHWDFQSCERRLGEAKLVSWVAGLDYPVLVAGDFNSTSSGPHEPRRDFTRQPPHLRHHKGWLVHDTRRWRTPSHGTPRWEPATEALDFLLGRWDAKAGQRMDGIGLHDLAEIAAFEHGQCDALTATVNTGVDAGGGLRIDRGLVNDAGRRLLVPGSFRVEIPEPPFPSDHRVIRFLLNL